MKIEVILTGPLSKYGNGSRKVMLTVTRGWTVGDLIQSLEIPNQSYSFAAIGGKKVKANDQLSDGDIVTIFPQVSGG